MSLKKKGYLYVAVKELSPDHAEEEELVENDYGYEYKRFFSYYSLDELKNYLIGSNMEIVYETVTQSGKTRWVQVITKKN